MFEAKTVIFYRYQLILYPRLVTVLIFWKNGISEVVKIPHKTWGYNLNLLEWCVQLDDFIRHNASWVLEVRPRFAFEEVFYGQSVLGVRDSTKHTALFSYGVNKDEKPIIGVFMQNVQEISSFILWKRTMLVAFWLRLMILMEFKEGLTGCFETFVLISCADV